ncbi:CASP C terminal-domain-containing protein [Entophlyctis helioformis]|nr:CASP C terminal-domain-containing protein [Entophlyctis helioformis]
MDGLAQALQAWEGEDGKGYLALLLAAANLPQLQRQLDSQGLSIIEHQSESTASRKRLADQTKDFRKVPDDEKLKEVKSLVKAYQSEIDNMNRRSKFAETAFLNLYKLLSDLPDPASLVSAALEQTKQLAEVANLQAENRRLRDDMAAAQAQVAAAKGAESSLDEMVAEKVATKEEEMKLIMDDKIRIYKETEYSLNRQLSQLKDQFTNLKSNHAVTQAKLVDETQQFDEGVASRLAELDIVAMDLERSNLKVSQLERENRLLKDQLNAPVDETEKDELISRLRERVAEVETENATVTAKLDETLAAQRMHESFEVAQLQSSLQEYSDYDEIKRELEIIKGIEFDGFQDQAADGASPVNLDHPLETLMMAKNKKLQSEITTLKATMLQETQLARDDLNVKLDQSQTLVRKLESDLLRVNESWASMQSKKQSVSEGLESLMSDSYTKTLSAAKVAGSADQLAAAQPPVGHSPADASIVPILTSQRDRYKQRYEEAQQTSREQTQTIAELRYEVTNLKSDNVKLYEKLRYSESFFTTGNKGSAVSAPRGITIDNSMGRRGGSGSGPDAADSVSNKYRGMYEDTLDPFRRFHQQEELRRARSMNPAERAALGLTRLLSTNKYSRWLFVVYSGALHLLVFVTLYQLSQCEDCKHGNKQAGLWNVHGGSKHPGDG